MIKNIKKWWAENYQGFSIGYILNLNFGKNKNERKIDNSPKADLFDEIDTTIIQRAGHSCVSVKFSSKESVVEYQKIGGKLVGISGLTGWVRQDCPILQEYLIKTGRTSSASGQIDKTAERILKYLNGNEEVYFGEFEGYMPEIPEEEINLYIEELLEKKFIRRSRTMSRIWLDEKGKNYLKNNKLIEP